MLFFHKLFFKNAQNTFTDQELKYLFNSSIWMKVNIVSKYKLVQILHIFSGNTVILILFFNGFTA